MYDHVIDIRLIQVTSSWLAKPVHPLFSESNKHTGKPLENAATASSTELLMAPGRASH